MWLITLDAVTLIPQLRSVLMDFLQDFVPTQTDIGEVGLLGDDDQATALVVRGIFEDVFLAFGEYELFS